MWKIQAKEMESLQVGRAVSLKGNKSKKEDWRYFTTILWASSMTLFILAEEQYFLEEYLMYVLFLNIYHFP